MSADSIIPIALFLYILRSGGFIGFFVASRHRVTVAHLYDFIRCIADGHCNEREARLWSMWSSHHHMTIHHINHDSKREGRSNRLLLRVYNNRLYWLFALYALIIFFFATTTSIPCDPTCNLTSLCHVEQHHRPLNTHIDYERMVSSSMDKDDDDPRYRFYRDSESGKYYVALRMIDGAYQWFHPPDLVRQFSSHNHTCICPVLMGIAENITFIESEGGEWLVMYQPFVYRNSTLSYRIESSLIYRKESPFYENYRQFMFKTGVPQSLIHHETMYIEYTEIWPQSAVGRREAGGEAQKDKPYEEGSGSFPLLLLNQEEPLGRQRRVTLTQSDTICFYFCDTMNSALIDR